MTAWHSVAQGGSPGGATARSAQRSRPAPDPQAPRLILRAEPLSLAEHLDYYGPPPIPGHPAGVPGHVLIAEVERSGLTGRGGGAFPAGRKLAAVARASQPGSRPVLVANASESEPASRKDAVLLRCAPHLVLDGIAIVTAAVGAGRACLCVGWQGQALRQAAAERDAAGLNPVSVEVTEVPHRYLSGQETALISLLNGGAPVPTFQQSRPSERGVQRRPTLVLNVETLAHIALIARYGAGWFRATGTRDAPGSALITITGAVNRPGVREMPLGTPLGQVLDQCGLAASAQAVLTGGYFGTWLPLPAAARTPVSAPGLLAAGATLGPGVLAVLPGDSCGLAETARVTAFLARQSAGQCGPCRNGLPALAEALDWIAFGQPGADIVDWVGQLSRLVTGRGACHLPDGAAALARSALSVFAADLAAHAQTGPCAAASTPPALPIPDQPR